MSLANKFGEVCKIQSHAIGERRGCISSYTSRGGTCDRAVVRLKTTTIGQAKRRLQQNRFGVEINKK